jgi:hypothetical protein
LTSPEFRLLYAICLSALVGCGSWLLARRFDSRDRIGAASDALLFFYLVQYLSVCLPGLVGALHPLTMALVAILLSVVMIGLGMRRSEQLLQNQSTFHSTRARAAFLASLFFVVGYVGTLVWHQRSVPVVSNDALTYHLPAAAQWLQTGRLGLYEAWYYNPANSYSPLGGSTYIAWLIAPLGNDVLARFVQVGPLIFLFIAMTKLLRSLRVSDIASPILAAGVVLVRSYVSQTILAKDDLFVAALFVVLIETLRRERLEQSIGPWRIGVALGLLLATKYTVLMSLPILLLMLGSGWTWRRAAIAIGTALVLAGPWYLRNWILTHNPLYPADLKIFPATLHLARSHLLESPRSVWGIFTESYYGLTRTIACLMLIGWLAGWIFARRTAWRDPLQRTVLIGPVIGIAIFVFAAPYGEMRFAYPALLLLFAAGAIVLARLPDAAQIGVAAAIALWSAASAFWVPDSEFLSAPSLTFTGSALVIALIGIGVAMVRISARVMTIVAPVFAGLFSVAVYVYWDAYVGGCSDLTDPSWSDPHAYADIADVWHFVRAELPPGAKIAYANTYFTYPLMGYTYNHRVVYVPTRRGLERFIDMPPIEMRTTGEEITNHIERLLRQDPDREQWLRRLRESGAQYLVVLKRGPSAAQFNEPPPEFVFANADLARFQRVHDSDAGSVFKIVW